MNPDESDLASRLRGHVEYLAATVGERNPAFYAELEQARAYIEQSFQDSGYQIRHDVFEVDGKPFRNVIAEKAAERRGGILVVGAHYDTVFGTPGADDNASAVAVLLELAGMLSDSNSAAAIRWVAFNLEEPPYFRTPSMGSWVHARKCREQKQRILGMISLEMLGYYRQEPRSQHYPLPLMRRFYPDEGNFVAVAGNFRSRRLVRRLTKELRKSKTVPVESTALPFVPGTGLSDNWSFWQEGFQALMMTDTAFFRNPHYHLPSDLPSTLDYTTMANLTRGLAEAIPRLAGRAE